MMNCIVTGTGTGNQIKIDKSNNNDVKRCFDDCGKIGHVDLGLIVPNRRKRPIQNVTLINEDTTNALQDWGIADLLLNMFKIGDHEFILQLQKHGWEYNKSLMLLEKSCDSIYLLVKMDELKNMIEQLLVNKTFLPAEKTSIYRQFAQKLEESILLYRIQRQISQIKAVDDSLINLDENISPGSRSKKKLEKKIPKFFHGTKTPLITSSILLQLKSELDQGEEKVSQLHFELKDDHNDPLTCILSITGDNDVDEFSSKLRTYIASEISLHNLTKLVQNPRSFELDIVFENRDLGIELFPNPKAHPRDHEGVWISNLTKDGQARKILGESASKGAAVLMINGSKVYDVKDFDRIRQIETGEKIIVTICLSPYAHLQDIDKHNRSEHNQIIVKRRNGTLHKSKSSEKRATLPLQPGMMQLKCSPSVDLTQDFEPKKNKKQKFQQSEKGKQKLSFYHHFVEKFQAARDIEYKNSGILGQSANKSLWSQHKLIYGERCDEFCRCPSDTKRLSETVVKDYLNKHRKKGTSDQIDPSLLSGKDPVGFLNCFVGRFYERVKKEFPDDSPKQILDKLAGIWNLHKAERRFGLNCNVNCPCTEAWKTLFLNECLRLAGINKVKTNKDNNAFDVDDHTGAHGQRNHSSRPIQSKKKNISQYSVIFNPHKPLGFYCVTKKGQCMITSVSSSVKDKNISIGTVVHTSATHLKGSPEEKKKIVSHTDLKNAYNAAKMKDNTKLKLWFSGVREMKHSRSDDWSSTGAWRGDPGSDGWAGGASLAHSLERSTLKQMQREKSAEKQESLKVKMRNAISRNLSTSKISSNKNNESDFSIKSLATKQPNSKIKEINNIVIRSKLASKVLSNKKYAEKMQKNKQRNSLLRLSKSINRAQEKKKVTFAPKLSETKFFTVNHEENKINNSVESTNGMQITQNQSNDLLKMDIGNNSPTKNKENFLSTQKKIQERDAEKIDLHLYDKKCVELIKILKSYNKKPNTSLLKKSLLSNLKHQTKILESNLRYCTSDSEKEILKEKKEDFYLKQRAMKIFIQAEYLIMKAKTLDEWNKIEFLPHRAHEIELTNAGQNDDSADYLYCSFKDDQAENKMHNQMLPLDSNLDWTIVPNGQKFQTVYNPQIGHGNEGRKIKIDLMKGKPEGHHTLFGDWSLNLIDLITSFHVSSNQIRTQEFNKSPYLCNGYMSVKFRCTPFTDDEIEEKRRETRQELSRFLDWIAKFGTETKEKGLGQLIDGNISFAECGNLSLLHAAVYLGDVQSIKHLLNLGADPKQKSDFGDALNLATNLSNGNSNISEKLNDICKALKADMFNAEIFDSSVSQPYDGSVGMNEKNHIAPNSKPDIVLNRDLQIHVTDEVVRKSSHSDSTELGFPNTNTLPMAQIQRHKPVQTHNHGNDIELENRLYSLSPDQDERKNFPDLNSSKTFPQPSTSNEADILLKNNFEHKLPYQMNHEINEKRNDPSKYQLEKESKISESNEYENGNWGSTPFGVAKFRNLNFLSQSSITDSSLDLGSSSNEDELVAPTQEISLPKIGSHEWIDGRYQRCSFFDSDRCKFGRNCNRAHVNPPIGKFMNDKKQLMKILNSEVTHVPISIGNFKRKSATNQNGEVWFTAAYVDPDTNIIYKAENKEGFESDEGIFWYKNANAATTAAKQAYLISKYWKTKYNDTQLKSRKRKVKEEEKFLTKKTRMTRDDDDAMYRKLTKENNLQNVFMKIHPKKSMKKSCWKTIQNYNLYSATFESPVPQDGKKIFRPTGFHGQLIDGIYYYHTLQQAKAATFYNYIMFCYTKGFIDEHYISISTNKKII